MFKICKIYLIGLAVGMFITTVGITREDTSRPKMPEWKMDYWGCDNIGLNYEEIYGRFGVVSLHSISKLSKDESGNLARGVIENNKRNQEYCERHYTSYGLYFQRFTREGHIYNHGSKKELEQLVKELGVYMPVASVDKKLWKECGLYNFDKESHEVGYFLIDPYGRIAARTPAEYWKNKGYKHPTPQDLKLLPYEQMEMEIAEYWLDTRARDIAEADKAFAKEKWKDAYKIYQPLAGKVKAVEAGEVIAGRVAQIENSVRDDILDRLKTLTAENISKVTSPLRKIQRSYKGTLLAHQASRHLAVLKRAKKDAELLDLIRLNVANTLTRLDRKEDAKTIYQSLAAQHQDDGNFQAELSLRIAGEFQLTKKQVLDSKYKPEECLEKAVGFFAKAEKLLGDKQTTDFQRKNAAVLLLAAAEHYTAAITNSKGELSGARERLTAVRNKLFWIASQQ
ncbi:hypothetical protein ACFL54_06835 [Planctomycetota bacterium]